MSGMSASRVTMKQDIIRLIRQGKIVLPDHVKIATRLRGFISRCQDRSIRASDAPRQAFWAAK